MATRYPGKGFYEYHRQFSLMAASHLKSNNILVDWSVQNNPLFCNLFANTRAQTCASCNSTLHFSGFCPLNRSVGEKRNGDIDSYGRRRQFHEGKEICQCFRRFVRPSDKSSKNSLVPVKVRIVTDQMSRNVEAMKTGKIIG